MLKIISSFIIALLFAPLTQAAFSDVNNTHQSSVAIDYLQEEGIIGGYSDGTFRPNFAINRAEMMKILVEGQGITPDENDYSNCFPDVGNEWFAKYVCYAKSNDWVGGYPDGTFKPANNVLDVEAMKMILNAKGIEIDASFTSSIFATVAPGVWYRPFLVTAEKLKLTEGFTPGSNYTRANVSEVIFRTLVIDRTNSESYSIQARNELLNIEAEVEISAPEYGAASYVEYTAEKREQYEGNRPFVLFFHASWCPICQAIETDLKTELESLPDGVLIVEANYDTEAELRQEFGVTRQYWFVVFNAEGEVTFSNNLFNADDVVEEALKTL